MLEAPGVGERGRTSPVLNRFAEKRSYGRAISYYIPKTRRAPINGLFGGGSSNGPSSPSDYLAPLRVLVYLVLRTLCL